MFAVSAGSVFGAAEPVFSHRLHVKLKPDCVSCHAAAPSSRQVSDNILPAKTVCLECHESVKIGKPARRGVDKFSHEQHLKLGNLAPVIAAAIDAGTYLSPPGSLRRQLDTKNPCVACHHGIEQSEQSSNANFPRMADCLVCHNKIDLPFSCTLCHAEGAQLKPANHTADFLDFHSSGKANLDKQSCAVCHGRRFTCLGCH